MDTEQPLIDVPDAPLWEPSPEVESKSFPVWARWLVGTAFVLAVVMLAGTLIRLPYYTISPGEALPLAARIKVTDTKQFPPRGDVMLLFVRERAHVNAWGWVQAAFDSDIDLYREAEITGGQSNEEYAAQAEADMASSKIAAVKVALEAAGYDVASTARGATVIAVLPSRPAGGLVEAGDVILTADGQKIDKPGDLGDIVRAHKEGESVSLTLERAGTARTVSVPVEKVGDSNVIGVYVAPHYDFPVKVDVDTNNIGGPSAGLAMSLAVLDEITPGELAAGKRVAVTGTIDESGNVGEIGGISQKAVTARAAGARLFLVPKCSDGPGKVECQRDLDRARERAGKDVKVVPVATFDEARRALREAGGDPVRRVAPVSS